MNLHRLSKISKATDLVDLRETVSSLHVDLRYTTTKNGARRVSLRLFDPLG